MKKFKKILSIMLTLAMAFTFTLPVFATTGNPTTSGTITVQNAIKGETYKLYKIFDLVSSSEDGAYAYVLKGENGQDSKWKGFFEGNEEGARYVTLEASSVDHEYNVVDKSNAPTTEADRVELAKKALEYATKNSIPEIATTKGQEAGDDVTATFTGLTQGYYLLDSSTGVFCSLGTYEDGSNNVVVQEKNEKPGIVKEIVEPKTDKSVQVGDTVNYKITITKRTGAQNYIVHDTMGPGLRLNEESIKVTKDGADVEASNYTKKISGFDDGCTFEIAFEDDYCASLGDGDTIVITYSAHVTKDAYTYDELTNTAELSYGDQSKVETTVETTTTSPIYHFDLVKTKEDNAVLTGAEFKLYSQKQGGNEIKLIKINDNTNTYRVADMTDEDDKAATAATITAGQAYIKGLANGTYYLEETKAPTGYNKLANRVEVSLTTNKEATVTNDNYVNGGIKVENKTGSLLPSTGGIGTTIFYIIGGILVVGAAVLLVTKKRMSKEV